MNAGCYAKAGFESKAQAAQIMQRTNRRKTKALNVYRCVDCKLFHIGTPSHKLH